MSQSFSSDKKRRAAQGAKLERLEDRLLYSADTPFIDALYFDIQKPDIQPDLADLIHSSTAQVDAQLQKSHSAALYVIDTSITDYIHLAHSIDLQANDRIVFLAQDSSGIESITDHLQANSGVTELHIFSHGSPGQLVLGSDVLNSEKLQSENSLLSGWSAYLDADTDLLFYACSLAQGEGGKHFIEQIAEHTGADIAASTDFSGNGEQQSNWQLEHQFGEVEADSTFSKELPDWDGVLANITVTDEDDRVDGDTTSVTSLLGNPGTDGEISLREAIIAANNSAGQDTIILGTGTYAITELTGTVDEMFGDFNITDDLIIRGESEVNSIISGSLGSRILQISNANVDLFDLSLKDGYGASEEGAAISTLSGHTRLFNVTLDNNNANSNIGGAVFVGSNAEFHAVDSRFINNQSDSYGGALFAASNTYVSLNNTIFQNNQAGLHGGAIHANGRLDLISSSLDNNEADADGGALVIDTLSESLIYDSDFTANKAVAGGAIVNLGDLTITGGYFENNHARHPSSSDNSQNIGGAILDLSTAKISDSTFHSNQAYLGGAYYADKATSTLTNVTLSQNEALDTGGAILTSNGSMVTVTHATFSGNLAEVAGSALQGPANSIEVSNSLFIGNLTNGAAIVSVTNNGFSTGFNAFGAGVIPGQQPSDLAAAAIFLNPLADNGGLVPTMELLAGSDGIDSGAGNLGTDASGFARDNLPDIGAFESRHSVEDSKVYWVDYEEKKIYRANNTGGPAPVLYAIQEIAQTEYSPWDIELDAINGRLIWTENDYEASNREGRIVQSSLDGKNQLVLADSGDGALNTDIWAPRGLALDADSTRLFVTRETNDSSAQDDAVLEYQLGENSLSDMQILFTSNHSFGDDGEKPDMSDVYDLEYIPATSFGSEYLVWSEQGYSHASSEAAITLLSLQDTSISAQLHLTTTSTDSPPVTNEVKPDSILWDESNLRLHWVGEFGETWLGWDTLTNSWTTDGAPNLITVPAQNSSGLALDPVTNLLYMSRFLSNNPADRYIFTSDTEHTTDNIALDGLEYPGAITIAAVTVPLSAPLVSTNNALSLNEGGRETIDSTLLHVTDNDSDVTDIVFTLDQAPKTGSLLLGAVSPVTLNTGDTFTQADLDTGQLSFQHDDSERFTDWFGFSVSDGNILSTNHRFNIDVNEVNDNAPIASDGFITIDEDDIAVSANDTLGNPFSHLAGISSDADINDPLTFQLKTPAGSGSAVVNPDGTFSYDYLDSLESGTDSFEYEVVDSSGQRTTATIHVTINPINDNLPAANADALEVDEGGSINRTTAGEASLLANDSDADLPNDSLSAQLVTGLAAGPVHGNLTTFNSDGTFTYVHDGTENFSDSFQYDVVDAAGNPARTSVNITITPVNDNSPVVPDDQINLQEGGIATTFTSGRDSLLDGLSDDDTGDTATVSPTLVVPPVNGTATLNPDNSFSYEHGGSETTSDQFIYRVKDADNNFSDVTIDVDITLVNENSPIVANDQIQLAEGSSTSTFVSGRSNLLDELSDEDLGDTATIQETLVLEPEHGKVTINADYSFNYEHYGSETPTDQFIYRVEDDNGNISDVTIDVTIKPLNDPPFGDSRNATTFEDSSLKLRRTDFGFSDPAERHQLSAIIIDALPQAGQLWLDDSLVTIDQTISATSLDDGRLRYEPALNDFGSPADSIKFRVVDSGGSVNGGSDTSASSNTLSLFVEGINDPPVSSNASVSVSEDSTLTFNLDLFSFSDPSDDNAFNKVIIETLPESGALTLQNQALIAGNTVTANEIAAGQFVYTPSENLNRSAVDSFTYRVVDNGGTLNNGLDTSKDSYTIKIDITAVNNPPVAAGTLSAIEVAEGDSIELNFSESLFTDNDDETLQYAISNTNGTASPSWITLDPGLRVLSFAPGYNDSGVYPLTLHASDSADQSANITIDITVTETYTTPEAVTPVNFSVDENTSGINLGQILVNDVNTENTHIMEVDDSRFSIVENSLWLAEGNTLNHEEESQISLNLQVSDATGASAHFTLVVEVNDINEAPRALNIETVDNTSPDESFALPESMFTDEDNDSLLYSATLLDGSDLPAWMQFDEENWQLILSEDAPAGKSVTVILTADDGHGGVAQTAIKLHVQSDEAEEITEPVLSAALPQIDTFEPLQPDTQISILETVDLIALDQVTDETVADEPQRRESEFIEDAKVEKKDKNVEELNVLEILDEVLAQAVVEEIFYDYAGTSINTIETDADSESQQQNTVVASIGDIPLASLFKPLDGELFELPAVVMKSLDLQRQSLEEDRISIERIKQTTATVGTGISVGYILWLLRSGVVLGSVLSALPAWRTIDPLPILDSLNSNDAEDQESLQSMIENKNAKPTLAERIKSGNMFTKEHSSS